MLELLDYTFFRNALLGVLILSIGGGMLGCYIVTRRLVSISGGITHACFGGLGLGYFLGCSPIAMAMVFAVVSALGVQWLGSKGRVREDSAIAVVWAAGMAVGVTFVFLTPGAVPELNSFLFGNILTINSADIWAFALFTVALAVFMVSCFSRIVASAFDSDFMRVIGVRAWLYNGTMTLFIAVGIVLMIRCVGMMLLMSMLSLPQLTAELYFRQLKTMMPAAIVVSALTCLIGLLAATVINVPASALIVAAQVGVYAIAAIVAKMRKNA
ncbi:MAG: metal ABC transporter permease [Bacteroides sp.]|nr:metal ABC transporter permease [Bacteroides sp.]MCM1378476.1 metal ABC transporter permease [Bacteroides sp.]MCM1444777.1 metal ABC transporter permease [Prevotella sp.]